MSEEVKQFLEAGKKNLLLIYALFLGGLLIPPLPFVGAVFAYANLNCSNQIWKSHYIFAFRTFCFGATSILLAKLLFFCFLGPLLYVGVLVWILVRSIIAIRLIVESSYHPYPLSLWI